jgi:hypothetical protein
VSLSHHHLGAGTSAGVQLSGVRLPAPSAFWLFAH